MSREYGDYEIEEFCSAGAKQYGMKMRHRISGELKYVLKLRGITLDTANCRHFQYEHFRAMTLQFGNSLNNNDETISTTTNEEENEQQASSNDESVKHHDFLYSRKFGPNQLSQIVTTPMQKRYKPVNQKGIIKQLVVYPFGY